MAVAYEYGNEDDWAVKRPDTARRKKRRAKDHAWGAYGRRPMRILAGVAFIDSVDRGILPGVLTKVQDDLGFGDGAAGVLGSVFVLMGFLAVLPAGYLADRYRRTRIIAVVLASWGAISALNAGVRAYWQFLVVRASLGVGETIDNPASASLMADYYPAEVRGRAYAYTRVAPIVGTAVGTALGGLVGAIAGWRWAFLIVGVPGSLLALATWRMKEPARGESDGVEVAPPDPLLEPPGDAEVGPAGDAVAVDERRGLRSLMADIRRCVRVRTLRSLMIGSAVASGATAGLAFWAPAFYERHTSLGSGGSAGVTGALILIGALTGTYLGGIACDRLRDRYEGAAMLVAGTAQVIGALALMASFLPTPLLFRMPAQIVGVAFIVAGGPALAAMIAEVVPATIRGIAFSVTGFLGAIAGAASPLLIGVIADQFELVVDGEVKGHIANAFLIVTPLVIIGGLVVLRGRRWVAGDTARAAAEIAATG